LKPCAVVSAQVDVAEGVPGTSSTAIVNPDRSYAGQRVGRQQCDGVLGAGLEVDRLAVATVTMPVSGRLQTTAGAVGRLYWIVPPNGSANWPMPTNVRSRRSIT
jgi:hypothetical protein